MIGQKDVPKLFIYNSIKLDFQRMINTSKDSYLAASPVGMMPSFWRLMGFNT